MKKLAPLVIAALLVGGALRLTGLTHMEYKDDERRVAEAALGASSDLGRFPSLGIPSGVYLRNPGLSVSAFSALAAVSGAKEPISLARSVALLNTFALFLLAALIWYRVPKPEQPFWWIGLTLAAVNPHGVLIQRKIWAQSLLPFFSVGLIWLWSLRERSYARFGFAALGLMMGQLHMSGWFFFAALALPTLIKEPRHLRSFSTWLGIAVGLIPMIPWLTHLFEFFSRPSLQSSRVFTDWAEPVQLKFWVFWISDALGLHYGNAVGVHLGNAPLTQLAPFLPYPLLGDQPTYGAAVSYALLLAAGVLLIFRSIQKRASLSEAWRAHPFTRGLLVSALLYMGVALTLSFIVVRRYYLVTAFPLVSVSLAFLILSVCQKRLRVILLGSLLATHFVLVLALGQFVFRNGGAPDGDYGTSYSAQSSRLDPAAKTQN